eukprot:scaffold114012_cov20-Tisochrysis_lutea.AAC.3
MEPGAMLPWPWSERRGARYCVPSLVPSLVPSANPEDEDARQQQQQQQQQSLSFCQPASTAAAPTAAPGPMPLPSAPSTTGALPFHTMPVQQHTPPQPSTATAAAPS